MSSQKRLKDMGAAKLEASSMRLAGISWLKEIETIPRFHLAPELRLHMDRNFR